MVVVWARTRGFLRVSPIRSMFETYIEHALSLSYTTSQSGPSVSPRATRGSPRSSACAGQGWAANYNSSARLELRSSIKLGPPPKAINSLIVWLGEFSELAGSVSGALAGGRCLD